MPLLEGKAAKTKEGFSENVRREKHAHPEMPIKQAVAIAYAKKRGKKKGGQIQKSRIQAAEELLRMAESISKD